MESYVVGGAVRDRLLGLEPHDIDYVVVGATPAELLQQGFEPVGQDFPVFLHPRTRAEYALARTERKVGAGYRGFSCEAPPTVTLEEDLLRRDLTINAMAQRADGSIVDPYGGQRDLADRWLRHVSPAFSEDPLRVLRVARFAAQLQPYGFKVAPDTLALMQAITASGELTALTPERVWLELTKAFNTPAPRRFFEVLRDCGALAVLLPELDALFGVPATPKWHPEVDTGEHLLLVIDKVCALTTDLPIRFAALCHDFGKGLTDPSLWPKHYGHGEKGIPLIKACAKRLKAPKDCLQLALLVAEYHTILHSAFELKPRTLARFISRCDGWRRPERVSAVLLACVADVQGRWEFEEAPYPQKDYVEACVAAGRAVPVAPFLAQGLQGPAIAEAHLAARVVAIAKVKRQWPKP